MIQILALPNGTWGINFFIQRDYYEWGYYKSVNIDLLLMRISFIFTRIFDEQEETDENPFIEPIDTDRGVDFV